MRNHKVDCGQTDTYENITFPLWSVIIDNNYVIMQIYQRSHCFKVSIVGEPNSEIFAMCFNYSFHKEYTDFKNCKIMVGTNLGLIFPVIHTFPQVQETAIECCCIALMSNPQICNCLGLYFQVGYRNGLHVCHYYGL